MSFLLGHLPLSMFRVVSAVETSISSRISIECSLLGGFDFGKARVSSVDFVVRHFGVGFRLVLRSFCDRLSIGLTSA